MSENKKVSILMSVYNEPLIWVREAIDSMLNQDYGELQIVIIIDDPTNMPVVDYIKELAIKKDNVLYQINDHNKGLVWSLNCGLKMCNGYYIARMDADDYSYPDRLSKEIVFLEKHNYDVVGCGAEINRGERIIDELINPEKHSSCVRYLRYRNCMSHPTWLAKKQVFDMLNGYRDIDSCEDLDFVIRCVEAGFHIGNTKEILFRYRDNENSISHRKAYRQRAVRCFLTSRYRKNIPVSYDDYRSYIESTRFNCDVEDQEFAMHIDEETACISNNCIKKLGIIIRGLISSKAYRFQKMSNQILKIYSLCDK